MTAHRLIKLTQRLYSKPHMISQDSFDIVANYLHSRNMMTPIQSDTEEEDEDDCPSIINGVGVICLDGALTYKPIQGMCGEVGCSYTQLLQDFQELIKTGVKTIVMEIDSGGGEGYGCMETADDIRKLCDQNDVYLIAYNDGRIASAAYAIACAADEVISNPSADTGSIGVLVCLYNDSKYLENAGVVRSFVYAGNKKIPYAEDGTWKESFIQDLQSSVDMMYEQFVSHVNKYTGIDKEKIRSFQAGMFSAEESLSNGLINQIMTRSQFVDYLKSKMVSND